jgi:hypothetical protein
MEAIKMEDINLFMQSGAGSGREANDANNKLRETILAGLFNGHFTNFLADSRWSSLKKKFQEALETIAKVAQLTPPFVMTLQQKGGRGYNYDFLVIINGKEFRVEFKSGGTSVTNIPEYFNPAADKPFHDELYARFFYHNYLPTIVALRPDVGPIPAEEIYMAEIHKNSSAVEFFNKLDEANKNDKVFYKQKSTICKTSIKAFLEKNKDTTNLATITAEFQRSQENKWFLLYSGGVFWHDQIKSEELIATGAISIRNGNKLVIQSAAPGTRHEMLLRWKNHLGVLLPAWQIDMKRTS